MTDFTPQKEDWVGGDAKDFDDQVKHLKKEAEKQSKKAEAMLGKPNEIEYETGIAEGLQRAVDILTRR